jgi:predicted dehydrogenase
MQRLHAPALRLLGDSSSSVRGCFDVDLENARTVAEATSATVAGPPAAVGPGDPVDAAIIATPPEAHAEHAQRYLSAAKHVFVEKPATVSAAELDQLRELAGRMGRRIFVGHFRRLFPSVQIARRLVSLGALGRLVRVEATEGFRWDWEPRSNYVVESPYGGVVHDTGSHLIDMAVFILALDEEPDVRFELTSVEKTPASEPSQHCEAELTLESPRHGAFVARVMLSRMGPLAMGVKIWGENGVLFIPARFAAAPVLRTAGHRLLVSEGGQGAAPASMWHSVLRMHEEFAAAVQDPHRDTVLDARRFSLLMRILDEIWAATPA